MDNIWTISINNAAPVALRELGFENLTLDTVSLATDTATLQWGVPDFAGELPLHYNDLVTLYRDGEPWFFGRVSSPERSGAPDGESVSVTVSGPWDWLERQTFKQLWNFQPGDGEPPVQNHTSRVTPSVLNSGVVADSGEALRALLEFGISLGHPYQIGEIGISSPARLPEMKNVKCAEVVRNILRLHPDCVAWFDYATSPPTFNVRRKDELPAVELHYGPDDALIESIPRITRRDDLAAGHVAIAYEITDTYDGKPYVRTVLDVAPPGTTGLELDCVGDTIPWQGMDTTVQTQRIKVRTIMDKDADAEQLPTKYYWQRIYPALAGGSGDNAVHAADFKFVPWDPVSGKAQDDPAAPAGAEFIIFLRAQSDTEEEDEDGKKVGFIPNLSRELLEGSIVDWMPSSIKAQRQRLTCFVSVKGGPSFKVSVDLTATNATSRDYTNSESTTAEPPPVGVAAAYLAAVSVMHHEGSVTLCEQEVSGAVRVGHVVNLAGGRAEWETMRALVQSVSADVATGRTTVNFGPPAQLGLQDFLERDRLFRGMRGVVAVGGGGCSQQGSARLNGSLGKDKTITGAQKTPVTNTTTLPVRASDAPHPYQVVDASDADGPKVRVIPGVHYDAQTGAYLTPTINGVPIDRATPPTLDVGGGDKMIVFKLAVKDLTLPYVWGAENKDWPGAIQSIELVACASIPANTNTEQYFLCDNIEVAGNRVMPKNTGVSGSQSVLVTLGGIMYSVGM